MSTKCSKKLPCLWEHSPAPTERKTASNQASFCQQIQAHPEGMDVSNLRGLGGIEIVGLRGEIAKMALELGSKGRISEILLVLLLRRAL